MPDGEIITRSSIVESSINFYKEAYQDNITDICDFSDGSEIRTLHESWAVELFAKYRDSERKAKMKYVKYARGTFLDELACEYHLSRKKSEVARGTVTFTTSANINGDMRIPAGTVILSRTTGYEYILQEDVILYAANTPVNGTVYSKLTGAAFNALEDTLTAFKNIETIRTEIRVTNPTPITDGRDGETDDELRERILKVKQERAYGTAPAYNNLLLENVSDLHDITFVDPDVLSSSQVTNSSFEQLKPYLSAVLYINAASKPCPEHVINEVEYVMTQQNNLVIGQKFIVEPAMLEKVYFSMELYVTASIDEDIIREQLECFFDGGDVETKSGATHYMGLNIGESVSKSQLLDVLEDIPGIHQVGYLKLNKYYPDIPTKIDQWNNNGGGGYNYIDDEGYTYWRTNSDESSVPHWGSKNFVELNTTTGKVFSLGQKKDLDPSFTKVFTITQKLVNDKGEVI